MSWDSLYGTDMPGMMGIEGQLAICGVLRPCRPRLNISLEPGARSPEPTVAALLKALKQVLKP